MKVPREIQNGLSSRAAFFAAKDLCNWLRVLRFAKDDKRNFCCDLQLT